MPEDLYERSVYWIWLTANALAWFSNAERIELIHLFLALLQFMEGIPASDRQSLEFTPEDIAHSSQDIKKCISLIGLSERQITRLRRTIHRAILAERIEEAPDGFLHRSKETKEIFQKALENAGSTERKLLPSDLLRLLLPIYLAGHLSPTEANFSRRSLSTTNVVGTQASSKPEVKTTTLDNFCRDLTQEARAGELPPVVGRLSEMTNVARILSRTSKRNVILVGEAGVGKTAVVEGLAQRVVAGSLPLGLSGLRILQMNIADIIAGTAYRGEMEQRLKAVIDEVTSDPNVVLFIDEIHLVAKSGSTSDSGMDVANILKPALARNDFCCIGATTVGEYERYLANDPAFKRRFHIVRVSEPSEEETIEIANAWAERIQKSSSVSFTAEAIETAVRLSHQFILDRKLPDIAIDLLENSAAALRVGSLNEIQNINCTNRNLVTPDVILQVLSDQYGIATQLSELFDLGSIENDLSQQLVGQNRAIKSLLEALTILSIRPPGSHLLGVLLLAGPPGSGKTTAAQCIARGMHAGRGVPLFELNLSEYRDPYSLARIIGAPPGLIGHDRQSPLFLFAQTHRQGVVLLKNFEAAHPDVQDALLAIMERGEIRDSRGEVVDFHQYLFLLSSQISDGNRQMSEENEEWPQELFNIYRAEALNQVDGVVLFQPLQEQDFEEILRRELRKTSTHLCRENPLELEFDDATFMNLLLSLNQKNDVRSFLNAFEKKVFTPIVRFHIGNPSKKRLRLIWISNKLQVISSE